MTTTPPDAPSGPRVDRDEVRDLGRLRRSVTDRKVAGVAGGLGRHLDIDPLVLRVAFVVLVFFGGAGLIAYGACWLLVPEDGSERAPFHLDERSRSVALLIAGAVAALALVGDSWGAFWFPWPLAAIALLVLWVVTRKSPPAQPPATYPTGYPPAHLGAYATEHPASGATATAAYPTAPTGTPPPAYPTPPAYVPPPRPPNPLRRGPILFWFTLALIALAEGVLGIVDLAGAQVAGAAYPALAVAICGLMLVVGAFFGRAGGLIAVGLIAAVALSGALAADRWDGERVTVTPISAAQLDRHYRLDAGTQVIDLREVADLSSLDGRSLSVEGAVGRIEVILPDDLAVTVHADIDGPGHIELFGRSRGGIDNTLRARDGSATDPQLTVDVRLDVGKIEVHR